MSPIRSLAPGAAALLLAAATLAAQEPARVRFVSLVPGAEVDVRARSESGDGAIEVSGLAPGAAGERAEATPGRYAIEVRSGGEVLERTTLGLGPGGAYTIAVVGLPAPGRRPGPETAWARIRRLLGGADAVSADALWPQVRVLRDGLDRSKGKARVRALHAAPGFSPLTLVARRAERRVTLASGLAYPRLGPVRDLEPGRWTLSLSAGASPPLLEVEAELRAGTVTTWFVVGGPGGEPLRLVSVVDPARHPGRAR